MLLLVLPALVTLSTYKISIHFCGLQSPPGSLRRKQTTVKPSRCSLGLENMETEKMTVMGDLISHLVLSFLVIPVIRQGTFSLLILLCQTPGRTLKGWPAVMVEGSGHLVGVWPTVSPECFGITPKGQRCPAELYTLYCTCWSNRAQNIGRGMKRKRTRVTILTSPISCF